MVGVSANIIRYSASWCCENYIYFTMEQIHAGHDSFNNLALPCTTFAYDAEQYLLLLGRIKRVLSPG